MITNTQISWGDQLGAQMTTLASLIYVSNENKNQLVLFDELRYYKRGYQFLDVFDIDKIDILSRTKGIKRKIIDRYCNRYRKIKTWKKQMKRIYSSKFYKVIDRIVYEWIMREYKDFIKVRNLKNDVHTNETLLSLDKSKNYDISCGFGTYQDWMKYEDNVRSIFKFKKEIVDEGNYIFSKLDKSKSLIAIHFRRTDYLVMSSLNLGLDYYKKAIDCFDKDKCQFVIFSDDIEGCKDIAIFENIDTCFMENHSAAIDMYLMSLCDGNIIANSTFSFWGAFLGDDENKKIVCPYNFIGESASDALYINGNYYPESWIAI